MRIETIKRRVDALHDANVGSTSYSIVELPDGTELEVTTQEWYDRRHEKSWTWKRFSCGHDPALHALDMVLSILFEECGMPEEAERWAKGLPLV